MITTNITKYFKPSVQAKIAKGATLGGYISPEVAEQTGFYSSGTGQYGTLGSSSVYGSGGFSSAETGTATILAQQADEANLAYKKIAFGDKIAELEAQGYNEQEINYLLKQNLRPAQQITKPLTAIQQFSLAQQRKEFQKASQAQKVYKNKADKLQSEVSEYEKAVKEYNTKFSGKQLNESEYNQARAESLALESKRKALETNITEVNRLGQGVEKYTEQAQERITGIRAKYDTAQQRSDTTARVAGALGASVTPVPSDLKITQIVKGLSTEGKKIEFKTGGQLISEGAIGTGIDVIAEDYRPYGKPLPEAIPSGIAYAGLRFVGLPASVGQTLGAVAFGKGDTSEFTVKGTKRITGKGDVGVGLSQVGTELTTRPLDFGSQIVLGSVKELTTDPIRFGAELFAFEAGASAIGSGIGFISSKVGLTKPIIKFVKSPIKEVRVGTGTDFVVKGKGILKYTKTTKLRNFLGKKPIEVEVPIQYLLDVSEKSAGKIPKIKVGKNVPVGSPYTLQGLIPEESLGKLTNLKAETIRELRKITGFETKGIVQVGGDPRIIKELSTVFPKEVRVRTGFGDLPLLEQPFSTFKVKVPTTGESGLASAKVSGINLSDSVAYYKQLIRSELGPKLDVSVTQLGGKIKGPFDYGKVEVLLRNKITNVKEVLKTKVQGSLSKEPILKTSLSTSQIQQGGLSTLTKPKIDVLVKPKVDVAIAKYTTSPKVLSKATEIVSSQSELSFRASISSSASKIAFSSAVAGSALQKGINIPQVSSINYPTISVFKERTITIPKIQTKSFSTSLEKTTPIISNKLVSKATIAEKSGFSEQFTSKVREGVTDIAIPKSTQKELFKQTQKFSELLKSAEKTITKTKTTPIVIPALSIPKLPPPKIPRTYPLRQLYPTKGKYLVNKPRQAFIVTSRVGGRETVLAKGLPKGRALSLGSAFARTTTARSFKIKPIGFTTASDVPLPRLTQFREPKRGGKVAREGFTFVEKSRYAIDTPEELRGITYKGLATKKTKAIKKPTKIKLNRKALRLLRV